MPLRTLDNEKELLREVAKGDAAAFTRLFDAYHRDLGEYIFRLTESAEASEDILQDVFLKVWQKREGLPALNSFTYYLFTLSKNRTLNHLRKKANEHVRDREWTRQFEDSIPAMDVPNPGEELDRLIDAALASLPAQQQRVYLLSRREHLKYREIAKELGISPETVKKHLQFAVAAIKQYLRNNWEASLLLTLWVFPWLC